MASSFKSKIYLLVLLFQEGQEKVQEWLEEILRRSENNINSKVRFEYRFVKVDMNDDESFTSDSLCKHYEEGFPIVLDMTWGNLNWMKLYQTSLQNDLPYFKLDITVGPTLRILDAYLKARNATDVTVIFEDLNEVHEALFYWVDKTSLRMLMMEGLDDVSSERVRTIRPLPSFYVVIATTENMFKTLKTV